MTDYVDVTFCVQFTPEYDAYGDQVIRAWADRLTRKAPTKGLHGAVPVMLSVRIPKAAFEPLRAQLIEVELPSTPVVGAVVT